jgi:hypothetical protein
VRLFCACTLLYSFDNLTEDKHIVKTKIYSLSIGYIINFCPIDRESEVPTDINICKGRSFYSIIASGPVAIIVVQPRIEPGF